MNLPVFFWRNMNKISDQAGKMADKADKMKARLPRGFVDRVPDDLRAN